LIVVSILSFVFQILPHEDSLSVVTEENMLACFNVNCSGALLFTQEMIGAVVKSNLKQVVGISSGFASIGDNTSGGYYSYRISKAGMSMMTKCLALEFEKDGVQCIAIEPGWVATDMGTSRHVPTPEQPLPAGTTRSYTSGQQFDADSISS
jgi:NAD(P)-dependent dehydrogenase (short-subunit alcohol dehydrogenase family)